MFIKKPSDVTGKTILSIQEKKGFVIVLLSSGEKFKIDSTSYVNSFKMYPLKELSSEEAKALNDLASNASDYTYLLKLISGNKLYSKKEIVSKLISVKHLTYQRAEDLLLQAYQQGLVNDENYVANYVNDASEKGYSKEAIQDKLISSKYQKELVEKYLSQIDFASHLKESVALEIENMKGRNSSSMEDNIIARFIKLGQNPSEIRRVIKEYFEDNPELLKDQKEKELTNLKSDMEMMISSLDKSDLSPEEKKEKIIRRLINRKYDYNNIVKIWKEIYQ